jgi:hypothetical protein
MTFFIFALSQNGARRNDMFNGFPFSSANPTFIYNIIIIIFFYTPESCLENDSYKLYFDRTILTDIHIKHNRPDIIILNKQQKQAYLLDIAVPNSHNITQTYNTKINKYLELSVAMRNLWCLEKISGNYVDKHCTIT